MSELAVRKNGVCAAGEAEGASERFVEGDRDGCGWVRVRVRVEGIWVPGLQ